MVPLLSIKIVDHRKPAPGDPAKPTENGDIQELPQSGLEPTPTSCDKKDSVQVPYLSPLVLRKELGKSNF